MTTRKASNMVAATDLFSSWAREGLDKNMEIGHSRAVEEMLATSRPYFPEKYRFVDIGCGNGWVVRAESQQKECVAAVGVDGAKDMIAKANSLTNDKSCEFLHSDLLHFRPVKKFDVAFSMEVLYYLSETQISSMLTTLSRDIIEKNGLFVFGIDHYLGECFSDDIIHRHLV